MISRVTVISKPHFIKRTAHHNTSHCGAPYKFRLLPCLRNGPLPQGVYRNTSQSIQLSKYTKDSNSACSLSFSKISFLSKAQY